MPTEEVAKAAAKGTALAWRDEWAIYFTEVARLTGLTLAEVMMFDLIGSFRRIADLQNDLLDLQAKHMDEWRQYIRSHEQPTQEGDDWKDPA